MEGFFRMILLLFCFILIVRVTELHAARDECQPTKCNHVTIRFPFRLKGQQQPENCSYPGFELSCMDKKQTVLELSRNVKFFVKHIDYRAQWIQLYDPQGCLARQLPNDLSASPFQEDNRYTIGLNINIPQKYTIFNCSGEAQMTERDEYGAIPCLSIQGFQVLALPSDSSEVVNLLNCTRTLLNLSVTQTFEDMLYDRTKDVYLSWDEPYCRRCEVEGRKCRLKKNNSTTEDETECYGPSKKERKKERDRPKQLMATGIILGSCLLGIILFALYRVHHSYKAEKEGQLKIENFLEDYKALKPSRYSYVDIKRITDQFKDKLGEGAYGTVFKGRLSNDVF
ncbi:hypothetical protein SLEP1_g53632 [Rubroshorea leprosula]|uniref:RING-type E3 ubiquitin transferase n=1 Tax=Rubroshorea leprosula TaxID=152421 RepID=A0AAV5MA51_9ROSI|nr:hypothetical protein SLEP1_g53632 [Rubroshorea leprosula]